MNLRANPPTLRVAQVTDPSRRCLRLPRRITLAVVASIVCALGFAHAQTPSILPRPLGLGELPPPPSQVAPSAPPVLVATIEGRPITQADYDLVANPYFAQLRSSMGTAFTADVQKTAAYSVMDELIRREVVTIEARKRGITVTEADTDEILRRNPAFLTRGVFDSTRFNEFKRSPQSNYLQMLPALRDLAAMDKLDRMLRRQFAPARAVVRAEWARQNDQIQFNYLALGWREQSLEPEASTAEWGEYYRSRGTEFEKPATARFRYFSLPIPAADDSGRAAAESEALQRGRGMADSLRRGTLSDSLPGMLDTGSFEVPPVSLPGLDQADELLAALAKADSVGSPRVLGPHVTADAVVIGAIVERAPRRLPPMSEVLTQVKRNADREKRRVTTEQEVRDHYQQNLAGYRGTRAVVTRRTWDETALADETPGSAEVERWYRERGARLFGSSDSSKAWLPPLSDSLRVRARAELERERRTSRIREAVERLVASLTEQSARGAVARDRTVAAETLTFGPGEAADSLFSSMLVDSLLARAVEQRGVMQGARRFRGTWAVWRVDSADSTYVPSLDRIRARVERDHAEAKRARDDAAGRAYFEARRAQYVSPQRYVLDFVRVPILPADSIRIPEPELRAEYERNRSSFRVGDQVRARLIFFSTRRIPVADHRGIRARADSVLALVKNGEDFATLARALSQDPGTASKGGDLGWRTREQYTREVIDQAFALQPGDVAPVIATSVGFHILKLEERRAAHTRPFAEVRDEIRTRLATARADTLARRAAVKLRRELAAAPSPTVAASSRGGLQTSPPLAAQDAIPGVGPVLGWGEAAAKLTARQWARLPYRGNAHYVVFRLNRIVPPAPAEFEEVRAKAVADTNDARRRQILDAKVAAFRSSLAHGASLDSLAAPLGGLKDSGLSPVRISFVLGLGFEPRVVQVASALAPGAVSDTVHTSQGVAWVRFERKQEGDAAEFASAAPQLTEQMMQAKYQAWVESKKRGLKIEVLRPDLRRPPRGT